MNNEIFKKLLKAQITLKAPKNQRNTFGNYNYRSCEDILEAVKPIMNENGLLLFLSDKVENLGDRYYVTATATLIDVETGEQLTTTASARESETKKGMDDSQITGTASSYARKYALNAMFNIDDTKDADATNTHGKDEPKVQNNPSIPKEVAKKEEVKKVEQKKYEYPKKQEFGFSDFEEIFDGENPFEAEDKKITFGKYAGLKTFKEIYNEDKKYFQWLLDKGNEDALQMQKNNENSSK